MSFLFSVGPGESGRRGKRKPERREEKDRPLPPLLARVGGNIEVRTYSVETGVPCFF